MKKTDHLLAWLVDLIVRPFGLMVLIERKDEFANGKMRTTMTWNVYRRPQWPK